MIRDLGPYPAYKRSGESWLGKVPAQWVMKRAKWLFRKVDRPVRDSDEVVTCFRDGVVTLRRKRRVRGFILALAKGIRERSTDYRFEAFGLQLVPVPPAEEQSAIVRFLDHADRRIQRYIRAKKKLISLLNEQRRAIIHRAVTRGLDPNVRLKPSAVEWLGEVPEHWKIARLKDAAVVQTGLTLGKNYRGLAVVSRPYLRVANVQTGRLDLSNVKQIEVPPGEAARSTLRFGDVLMTEGGDIDKLGRGCVWRDELPECLHQNHIFAVRCLSSILIPEFLVGLMASQLGRAYFQLTAKQTTNLASTNSSTLRAFPVLVPSLAEQQSILDEIKNQTTDLDIAISRAEKAVRILHEYRTRLIADVVTGKLDVRETAAGLPGMDEEMEPLDEDEALAEHGEEGEGADLDADPEEAVA